MLPFVTLRVHTTARRVAMMLHRFALGLALLLGPVAALAADRPNVVLILADDLGIRDLGCCGSTYHETPNIDRLAARGVRLTNAFSASPLCSPTRASIMTGQHPARTGITAPACHIAQVQLVKGLVPGDARVLVANSLTRLRSDYYTLAEALRDAGYATAHFGKWHLGHNLQPGDAYEPRDQGFDLDWPHTPRAPGPGGGGGYLAPWKFIDDPTITDESGRHIDERMADEAGAFIRASKGRPFFVNFWLFSVHSPWNARRELISHFEKKVDPANPQRNPLYAAMVKSMDDAVGRLLHHLEDSGEADNTVVVFWSDNGGYAYPPKKTDPEGYASVPATSNLPYRSGKASLYDGGTREPGIVVWPGRVKSGTTADFLMQSTDLYPTLLTICGASPREGQVIDGLDQTTALTGGASPRTRLFCHFPHGNATRDSVMDGFYAGSSMRQGDLKLIRFYARAEDGADELELYDVTKDPGERTNIAAAHPDAVSTLNELLQRALLETEAVIPRFNPARVPRAAKGAPDPDALPGGWKNRAGVARVHEGAINVRSKGPRSFLGVGVSLPVGPTRISFRVRAPEGGEGRVALLTSTGATEMLSVPYTVVGDSMWQTVTLALPLQEHAAILRLYLPVGVTEVDFADIVLTPAVGRPRRWNF